MKRFAVLVLLSGIFQSAEAEANWFVGAEGGVGQSTEKFAHSILSDGFEGVSVYRAEIHAGRTLSPSFNASLGLSYSERGSDAVESSVLRPNSRRIDQRRGYVDITLSPTFRWAREEAGFALGVSPRLSFLVMEPRSYALGLPANSTVIGADPFVNVEYGPMYLSFRYHVDVTGVFDEGGESDVDHRDQAFYVSLGVTRWLGVD